jgi:oligopeptidase B
MSETTSAESLPLARPTAAPVARREPAPATLHGITLQDDYRWLREKESPEVIAYLNAENAWT